jgi:hypothetical protein
MGQYTEDTVLWDVTLCMLQDSVTVLGGHGNPKFSISVCNECSLSHCYYLLFQKPFPVSEENKVAKEGDGTLNARSRN